ncbi:MAG: hypothetical protein IT379_05480 [Deltaproteobacteria bacterium]|nr:hypothetical protein [Deltaproteobacteria bacterium]
MSGDEMDDYLAGPVPEGLELDVKPQASSVAPTHLSRAALGEALAAELEGPSPEELADAEARADFGAEPTWFLGSVPYAVRVVSRLIVLRAERRTLSRTRAQREADFRDALADLGRHAFKALPPDALRGPLGEQLARVQTIRRESGTAARRAEAAREVGHRRVNVLGDRISDLRGEQNPVLREAEERGSAAAALSDIAARAAARRAAAERALGAVLEAVTNLEAQAQGGLEPAALPERRVALEAARQELERARAAEAEAQQRAAQAESIATARARDASQLRIQIERTEAEREALMRNANASLRKKDPAVAMLDDAFAELGDRVIRIGASVPDSASLLSDIRRRSASLDEVTKELTLVTLAPRTMNKRAFTIGTSVLGALLALVLFVVVFELVR